MINHGTGTWARYTVESVEWRGACKQVRADAGRLVGHETDAEDEEIKPVCAKLGIDVSESIRIIVCQSRDGWQMMIWVQVVP